MIMNVQLFNVKDAYRILIFCANIDMDDIINSNMYKVIQMKEVRKCQFQMRKIW
jgi:hypothetical protein